MEEELKLLLTNLRDKGATKEQLIYARDKFVSEWNLKKKVNSDFTAQNQDLVSEQTTGSLDYKRILNEINNENKITPESQPSLIEPLYNLDKFDYKDILNEIKLESFKPPKKLTLEDRQNYNDSDWKQLQQEGLAPPDSEQYEADYPIMPNKWVNKTNEEIRQDVLSRRDEIALTQKTSSRNTINPLKDILSEKSEIKIGEILTPVTDKYIDKNNLKLEYPYRYYADNDNKTVDEVFNTEQLSEIGVDIKDFHGFINKKGHLNDYLKNKDLGIYEGDDKDTFYNWLVKNGTKPELANDMAKYRMLELYLNEKQQHNSKRSRYTSEQSKQIDQTKLKNYIESEFPVMTKALQEKQRLDNEEYIKFKNKEVGFWYGTGKLLSNLGIGFTDAVTNSSASIMDLIGLDSQAENARIALNQDMLSRPNIPINNISTSGRNVTYNGREYLVATFSDAIIDKEIGADVSSRLTESEIKQIKKLEETGEKDTYFSNIAASTQTGTVLGDMGWQIMWTAATRRLMPKVGKFTLPDKLRGVPNAIIAQGTLGYANGSESAYKEALDAGLNETEAKEIAHGIGTETAVWYGATAVISPQTKAAEGIFGLEKKQLINGAIKAYNKNGLKGFNAFKKNFTNNLSLKNTGKFLGNKAVTFLEEGGKEVIQENIQQFGESTVINQDFNELLGQDIRETDISYDNFLDTSILSLVAGGFSGTINLNSNATDQLSALKILADGNQDIKEIINPLIYNGTLTEQDANVLVKNLEIYKKQRNKIPAKLKPSVALNIMHSLDRIEQLETEKKQVDKSFHGEFDEEIESTRLQIQKAQEFSNLSDKEIIEYKEQAYKELKPDNDESFSLNDAQITDKAIEIYSEITQAENTTTDADVKNGTETSPTPKKDTKAQPKTDDTESQEPIKIDEEAKIEADKAVEKTADGSETIEEVLERENETLEQYEAIYGKESDTYKNQVQKINAIKQKSEQTITTRNGLSVRVENGKTVVTGKKNISNALRSKAIKEAFNKGLYDNAPFTDTKKAGSPEEAIDMILENSENPFEIVRLIENEIDLLSEKQKQEQIVEDILLKNVNRASFIHQTGLHSKDHTPQIKRKYLRNKGTALDMLAMQIEYALYGDKFNANNPKVTENTVENWIYELANKRIKSDEQIELEEKFREITGLPPSKQNIERFIKRDNAIFKKQTNTETQQQEEDIFEQELVDDEVPFSMRGDLKGVKAKPFTKVLDKLLKSLPSLKGKVKFINNETARKVYETMDLNILDKAQVKNTPSDKPIPLSVKNNVLGFVHPKTGEIYINEDALNANTPIHEFGHVWIKLLKTNNKPLYKKMMRAVKMDKKAMAVIANDPNYKHLKSPNQIAEEALATAIGNMGERAFWYDDSLSATEQLRRGRLLKAIQEALRAIKEYFVGTYPEIAKWSDKQWEQATVGDLGKAIGKDLIRGKEIKFDKKTDNNNESASFQITQDNQIWKSTAKEGISKINQKSATPEQWVKMIADKGGKGTTQELEWIGLKDFLTDWVRENKAKSIPKEVVEQYIKDNQIDVVEVQSPVNKSIGTSDFTKLVLEGGKNYQEVLLTLPDTQDTFDSYRVKLQDKYGENSTIEDYTKEENDKLDNLFKNPKQNYKSSHWDETNVLAHLRINERTLPNGERVMFIEEMQSDIAQDTKKTQDKFLKELDLDFEKTLDKLVAQGIIDKEC
jgi:hypothetical protein